MKICSKCGTTMEPGFIAGAPMWGNGTGAFHKKTKVIGYLCPNCGYLEFWQEGK